MTPRLSVDTQNNSNKESYTQWKKLLGPLTVEATHIELYESIGQGEHKILVVSNVLITFRIMLVIFVCE